MTENLIVENTIPKPRLQHNAWLIVGLLCIVGCLNYLDRVMLTTMRDSILKSIPMTDARFGLLTSVFLWVYGILSPFAGFMADKFSRSRVIIFSLFIWSAVTWLTAHATTFEELLATRALMGISEACYLPAALALITDYHKGTTRSLAVGIHMAGIMVGQSLGFLGGWIADWSNWTDAFQIFGAIGVAYSVVLYLLLRDAKGGQDSPSVAPVSKPAINFGQAVASLFSKTSFIMLFLFWGMLGVIGWMIMGWLPTYYKEHFSLTPTQAGMYATLYMYPLSMFGVVFGGFVADRWHKRNKHARILVPVIGLIAAAPAVYLASSATLVYVAIGGFMVYGFCRVFSDTNLMPMLCMVADNRYIATGYGVLNMFSCIVGGIGIYASGVLRDAHVDMSQLFKIAALTMIVCAALLLMVKNSIQKAPR